jgi:transcription elongation factor GreB
VSKAFTKEDSAAEELVVPPRAPLPDGVPNYVTPRGLELLRAEREALEAARAQLRQLGAQVGDSVRLEKPGGARELEVLAIE